jgi:hypothetical protein
MPWPNCFAHQCRGAGALALQPSAKRVARALSGRPGFRAPPSHAVCRGSHWHRYPSYVRSKPARPRPYLLSALAVDTRRHRPVPSRQRRPPSLAAQAKVVTSKARSLPHLLMCCSTGKEPRTPTDAARLPPSAMGAPPPSSLAHAVSCPPKLTHTTSRPYWSSPGRTLTSTAAQLAGAEPPTAAASLCCRTRSPAPFPTATLAPIRTSVNPLPTSHISPPQLVAGQPESGGCTAQSAPRETL